MKRLLCYLREYRIQCIAAPLCKMLEASFELCVPLVVAAIIDRGIPMEDNGYLLRMCLLMVLLGAIGLTSTLFAQYFSAKAAVGFGTKLRHAMMEHIQSLSFSDLDRIGTSTLITRMTGDVNQVQTGVNLTLRLLLRSPFIVLGALVMAFIVDCKTAIIFSAMIPALSIVVFGIMLLTIPMYRNVQGQLDNLTERTRDNLNGFRVIRAFGREQHEINAFTQENGFLTAMQNRVSRISALMNPLTYVIVNGALIALLFSGALQIECGVLKQGQVVALYNYLSQILVELIKLANLIINLTKSAASGDRIADFLADGGEMDVSDDVQVSTAKRGTVQFDHVSFSYENAAEPSLSDISFTAQQGEMIGIIGGTGAGKSTLVNLLGRFYEVTDGKLTINGIDSRNFPKTALRARIGFVPQKAVLFSGSIRENLRWGNDNATDEELMEAVRAAQASDVIAAKANGLDELLTENGGNLSGGQRQRLTIARALVRKPEFLVLDDSTSALDFATEAALRKALRNLPYHPTVFLVSQRTASLRFADHILVLDDGIAVDYGTHDELLSRCDIYREIHESQFSKGEATA